MFFRPRRLVARLDSPSVSRVISMEDTLPLLACAIVSSEESFSPLAAISFAQGREGWVIRTSVSAWRERQPDGPLDLAIIDGRGETDALAATLVSLKRRHPSATVVCLNVAGDREIPALLAAGADVALLADTATAIAAAYLEAAIRRATLASTGLRVRFGDVVYERETRRVWCAGREVQLTPCELRLFDILFRRAGSPVSVDTLYDYVWHDAPDTTGASNALAVYVRYLRRKLMASRATVVETLRGRGYRLARR
jgi:two-component system OmpR family response regulator